MWNGTGYAQYGYPSSDAAALAYRTHLLWNFAEATSVQIGPGLAWEGSVLAPYATVRLTGGAALNGSVIAAAATTGGSAVATELHPYAAAPPCLPPTGTTSGTTSGTTVAGGSTSATTTATGGPTTLPAPPTTLSPYCITYGDLSGTVFEDHDANGVRDPGGPSTAVDGGVAGVTVKAFDAAGAAVGVATSGADGTWRMNVVHSASRDVRIEFSGLPAGYLPGSLTTTGGTVQFVSLCDQGVDLAVEIPTHYCQDNPDLAASCQRRGASTSPVVMTQKWGAGWNATAADTTDPASEHNTGYPDGRGTTTAHPVATPATDVGSVSALAWRPATRTLYAAAYVKTATVMGPGGPGAVYAIPVATSGAGTAASVAVTLPAAAGGAPAIGADGTPSGFDDAGRTGLGGVAVVSDPGGAGGDALYVVGLADRLLYRVTNLDAAAKTVTPLDLPLSLPGAAQGCATVDVRPFGLTTWDGVLYAALTCTAESTRDANQVRAYVYGYTPAAGWTATPALELPLTYDRGLVNYWGGTPGPQQHWLPWSADGSVNPGQALVTDLAVTQGTGTAPGALIVGLRSRAGDRVTAASDIYWSGGDVLLAPRQGAGWVPEPGLSTTVHSEYFLNDGYPFSAAESAGAQGHLEAARGAVAAIPGYRDVAVTQLTNWWTSGIAWHSLTTGRIQRALSLYRDETGTTDTFGKTNSLGDLVALCDQAPIEIGDRVWADANDNGIQDVGEFGLAGVQVELRAPTGIVLATTVTDGLGQYVFRGLLPRTGYRVWVDLEQPVLAAKGYREAKAGQGADRGLDNDASRSEHWVVAAVTSRNPGDNDHSIDIGLAGPPGDRPRCSCATTTTTAVEVPLAPPPPKPTYVSP